MNASRAGGLSWLLLVAILAVGAARVIEQFWVCDDAFITFRYAANWVDGLGLVYNAGERVEGYTNFLWTVLIAGGLALGGDAVRLGNVFGLLFFTATVVLVWRTARRMSGAAAVPVAAIGLVCHYHSVVFASCGLETAMFAFLATALFVVLIEAQRPSAFALAGLLGTFAAMTRPDGMLLYGVGGLFALLLSWRQRDYRPILAMAVPGLLVYVPYFIWKFSYYGYPFPNTFYAKSGDKPYLDQGWLYVRTYFRCYYVLAFAVLFLLVLLARRVRGGVVAAGWAGLRAPLLLAAFVFPYVAFVVWVGGDFMFARFLLPVTPALYIVLQMLAAGVATRAAAVTVAVLVALSTLLMWYPDEIEDPHDTIGFTEEKLVYPPERMEEMRQVGLRLRDVTRGTDVHVLIYGSQAVLAYYGEFPLVIEGSTGLTDEFIAHQPIEKRFRVGHEKSAPPEYLMKRRVDFLFGVEGSAFADRLGELRDIDFGGIKGTILMYRRQVMDRLVGVDGVEFTPWPRYLDSYIGEIETKTLEDVRLDFYGGFKPFYFDLNDDPVREKAFLERLR